MNRYVDFDHIYIYFNFVNVKLYFFCSSANIFWFKKSKWLKFAICNLQKFENVVFIEWKMYAYWQQNLTLVYLECATKLANDEYFKEC